MPRPAMPVSSRSRIAATFSGACLAAIAFLSRSASPGVNPAQSMASCMACSCQSATPRVGSSAAFASGWGYVTGSSPRRRRSSGCLLPAWMGPGRMMEAATARSSNFVGRSRGSVEIWARDSTWKTPIVSPRAIIP